MNTRQKALCCQPNLSRVEKNVPAAQKEGLAIFSSAITHKEGVLFRATKMERGSWQGVIFKFMHKRPSVLKIDVRYLICNSEEVMRFFLHTEIMSKSLYCFFFFVTGVV